ELAFEAVEVRKQHPSWGPKKIAAVLQRRHPGEDTPSLSTVARILRHAGLMIAIQSDNGPPFASVRAPRGLTELSAWWVSLGILVVRSRPGCPQDNGG